MSEDVSTDVSTSSTAAETAADGAPEPGVETLPRPVRSRVVQLTADVLPDVVRLPPPLRRVASFAPARRARLGSSAIVSALGDAELRERVGTQVASRVPAARSLTPADDADATELAALAWLVRPAQWPEVLEAALARVSAETAGSRAATAEVERLRGQLAEAESSVRDQLRAQRERYRSQIEELRSENSTLRRRLGETRAAAREARAQEEEAVSAATQLREAAESDAAAHEKELRQLRAQVSALEASASQDRRDARSERDEASIRARLLLDTVIDAASGLQRELALPPTTGAPGDRVEAEVVAQGDRPAPTVPGRGENGAGTLEHLLAMPRARLIIDGYNVTKSAYPSATLEAQRNLLLAELAPLVARTGAQTTVVFDAAETTTRALVAPPRGVKVIFSPHGVIADDVIRELVAAEPPGRVVVVVSSDREVAEDVVAAGARSATADAFIAVTGRSG